MGVAACTVGAVATKEMCASWCTVVGRIVRHVAIAAGFARAFVEEVLANSDFVRVVGEAAGWAISASTCDICQSRPGWLTSMPNAMGKPKRRR